MPFSFAPLHPRTAPRPAPPERRLFLLESRAALDFAGMLGPLASASLTRTTKNEESQVIVVPGIGSGDSYTLPLRRYLGHKGFRAEGWGLGTNLGGSNLSHQQEDLSDRWDFEPREEYKGEVAVPYVIDRLYDRVCQRHEETGRKISLVGWSLGGYMAREVARDLPDVVDRVITMGSPVVGGPKYTAVAPVFERRGQDLDWIEAEISRREQTPIQQPITAIYSKTDGIVGWKAAIDYHSPHVRHVEFNVAHLGMGFNKEIWEEVLAALRESV